MIIDKLLNLKTERVKNIGMGIFDNEDDLMVATKRMYTMGVPIIDVFTPYPIHNLDKAMGLKRTRLPMWSFAMGLTGLLCAFLLQRYIMVTDWPIIIGGKPHFGLPAWVPVLFELTILFTAFGTAFAFFLRNNMAPGANPDLLDIRQTDDKMVLALNLDNSSLDKKAIYNQLKQDGAIELKQRNNFDYNSYTVDEISLNNNKTTAKATKTIKEKVAKKKKSAPAKAAKAKKIKLSEEDRTARMSTLTSVLGDAAGKVDDLKIVKGIGPVYEGKLNSLGIYTFEQISKLNKDAIVAIEELTQYFPGKIEREDWMGQAKKLIK